MEKVANALKIIFSVALMLCVICMFIIFCGFMVALVIGGAPAAAICAGIAKLLPVFYKIGCAASFVGIIKMYLCKEKEFVLEINRAKKG